MTWNAKAPGYWETGYDPTAGRYGVPASQHPDYKALHKALKSFEKERKAHRQRRSVGLNLGDLIEATKKDPRNSVGREGVRVVA